MIDIISRQDALDTLVHMCRFCDETAVTPKNCELCYMRDAFDAIEALPSVEQKLDEWCTDCKEYDQKQHCCHRWNRVIRTTVEEMKKGEYGEY